MQNVIEKFYTAFQNLDAEGMAECYHDNVQFKDPAFGPLKGEKVRNMWRMLCSSQTQETFKMTFSDIEENANGGKAQWQAWYTFSKTGRKVHNIIDASFKIQDGKIVEHIDSFDLYRWSKQALGTTGFLIGWTGFFQKKLYGQTNDLLTKFEEKNA